MKPEVTKISVGKVILVKLSTSKAVKFKQPMVCN